MSGTYYEKNREKILQKNKAYYHSKKKQQPPVNPEAEEEQFRKIREWIAHTHELDKLKQEFKKQSFLYY